MLISCTSCKSKYLINSADLKPNGRTVKCSKCGNQWYQDPTLSLEDKIEDSAIPSFASAKSSDTENKINKKTPNLPSTFVKEQKVSVINSILVFLFSIILISGFWFFQNLEINNFVLFKYYINEFIFNLKLIFDDIAKIIYKIINYL